MGPWAQGPLGPGPKGPGPIGPGPKGPGPGPRFEDEPIFRISTIFLVKSLFL